MQNDIYNELSTNFIEYAVAVNSDRSIPDAKSGLKPVARRILWSAYENGYKSSKPHVKSARIVGDVMGTYHPHGDSAIYEAMVRLSRSWVLRYPLIDWHGNNGNIAGDGAAASRYTEARLSKIAEEGLLQNIKKKNVDFTLNYDETTEEPLTLPAIFPNLLCNPNEGIGVAMACKWAPHNLNEVATAILDYLDGKEPMLSGPDFPTGGLIINKNDIPSIMKTGHGTVKIRGKYKIEGQKIVFYEIPYGQTIEGLINEIGQVSEEKVIENIVDVHDESNKKSIRIVIEVSKGTNPEGIINKLFAKTNLQSSFSYNQVALVSKTPTELNLKDAIKIYIDHNNDCLLKEFNFDLAEATERKEVVEGLLKAIASIDEIISIIKSSENKENAAAALVEKFQFTDRQVKAILAMRLSSLTKLDGIELNKENNELTEKIKDLNNLINNKDERMKVLVERLNNLVKKYGDARRTELAQIEVPKEEKEVAEVVPEDVVVVVSQTGDIKRIPRSNFKTQNRNGKGIKSIDDAILTTISTNTVDTLMIFTSGGKMYRMIVDKVPVGTNVTKGTSLHLLLKMDTNEKIIAVTSLHKKSQPKYAVFFTKKGLIKKTLLTEYLGMKKSTGIQAIRFKEGDSLATVLFFDEEEIIVLTKKGMSIRFKTDDINPIGRLTCGVKAITLKDDDEVVKALCVHKLDDNLLIVYENGNGKKVDLSEFTVQLRGGKGLMCSNGDFIAGAAMIDDKDEIVVVGASNAICLKATDINKISRTSLGNKLIKSTKVLSVVKI